jgi:hypothetical protein
MLTLYHSLPFLVTALSYDFFDLVGRGSLPLVATLAFGLCLVLPTGVVIVFDTLDCVFGSNLCNPLGYVVPVMKKVFTLLKKKKKKKNNNLKGCD